jgi:PAS domain S-box-containing protein
MINDAVNNFNGVRVFRILEHAPIGIITFNAEGKIDFVNSVFTKISKLYHLNTGPLWGSNIFEKQILPDVSIIEQLEDLKKGYSFEREIRNLKTSNHSEISLIIKGSPVFEKDIYTGGILIIEDLKVVSEAHAEPLINLNQLQNIFNSLIDLLFIIDENGFIKYSAGKKISLLNIDNKEKDVKLTDLIPDLPLFPDTLAAALSSKEEIHFDAKIIIGNKHSAYSCTISPVYQEKGKTKFLLCSFSDISVLKNYETQLDRLKLFEAVSESIADAVFAFDYEGRLILWNHSSEILTGINAKDALNNYFWKFIPSYNEDGLIKLRQELAQLKYLKKKILIKNKKGKDLPVDAAFILSDDGNTILAVCTQLKKEEKEKLDFKVLEENFRDLVSSANGLIIRLSPEGKIQYANPAFTKLLSYKEEEYAGRNFLEFIEPQFLKEHSFDFNNVVESKSIALELPLLNKRKETNYFFGNFSASFTGESLNGFNIYLVDISDRKKSEKNLLLFKQFFENSGEGIAIESNGKIIFSNAAFVHLFGFQKEKNLTGKDILDLVDADDALRVAEYFQLKHSKKDAVSRLEFSAKRKDSTTFSCEITVSSFPDENQLYLILVARDVSERKSAQKVIRESEEKYKSLIENIDDFIYTFEKKEAFFKPTFFTASVQKITGYSRDDMMKDSKLLFKLIHPDDFASLKENFRSLLKSKIKNSGEFEFRIINKQGNIVWVRNKITVERNKAGDVQKIYGLISDITLRKKAEEDLQKSTQNLLKLNETKDRFISIISHDLRTPFSSILGFTDLLLNDETLSADERVQYIKYIRESSTSMLALVNSLLDWTRLQTGRIQFEPERTEASDIIMKSINSLSGAALQKNIRIKSLVPSEIFVFADKGLIGQVFNNLISNAIKFTKPGGKIVISALASAVPRFYEFSVKDSGVGIKPDDLKKLFGVDTKFTMEGTAGEKGTGLGLSLVKEIIERHGGSVKVESEFGKGSDFRFTLPVTAANILIADPNTTERILYTKILKHIAPDYHIEAVSNGKEALKKLTESHYALVITEHNMPAMGGYDFILELKKSDLKIKPPVIVLSSKIDRQTMDDYNRIGVENVFQKPVDLSVLKKAVEKSLTKFLNM